MLTTDCLHWRKGLAAVAIGCAVLSCVPPRETIRTSLLSDDPAERIRAIVAAGNTDADHFLPDLIERLDDEDAAVRFCAIMTLEERTGTRLGYSYAACKADRQAAIAAWREHIGVYPAEPNDSPVSPAPAAP